MPGEIIVYSCDYLAHHGVLGMRWGVHRAKTYKGSSDRLLKKRGKLEKENEKLENKQYKYDTKKSNYQMKAKNQRSKISKKLSKYSFTDEDGNTYEALEKVKKNLKTLNKMQRKASEYNYKAMETRNRIKNHKTIIDAMNKRYDQLVKERIRKSSI